MNAQELREITQQAVAARRVRAEKLVEELLPQILKEAKELAGSGYSFYSFKPPFITRLETNILEDKLKQLGFQVDVNLAELTTIYW